MTEATITIKNESGLHARPANVFIKKASEFKSRIRVEKDGSSVDGKSILGVLTLGAGQGSIIKITADGVDEKEAILQLTELIERGLEE